MHAHTSPDGWVVIPLIVFISNFLLFSLTATWNYAILPIYLLVTKLLSLLGCKYISFEVSYLCHNGVQSALSCYNFSKITFIVNWKNLSVQLIIKSKFLKRIWITVFQNKTSTHFYFHFDFMHLEEELILS